MKFEDMHVKCETVEQRKQVESILLENGFEFVGVEIYGYKDVCVSAIAKVFAHTTKDNHQKQYNFEDFMNKYGKQNQMIELINKAKSELKMNDSELSLALGKSRQYIGKMLRLPQSKKVQDKVIKEISEFMDKVKNPVGECKDAIISNIEIVNPNEGLAGAILNQAATLSNKDREISDLKKANEQQKIVIGNLDDRLTKAEKIHNEDVKAIEKLASDLREEIVLHNITKDKSNIDQELINELTDALQWEQKEFDKTRDELNELKSSHTTSKALNWFFVVAIILAAIVWKAYNG